MKFKILNSILHHESETLFLIFMNKTVVHTTPFINVGSTERKKTTTYYCVLLQQSKFKILH